MNAVNNARAFSFLARVFSAQKNDPFCGGCKAFVNSVVAVREKADRCEQELAAQGSVSDSLREAFLDARATLHGLSLPEDAPGQKRAGKCLLPQGVCFVKSSLAILDRI